MNKLNICFVLLVTLMILPACNKEIERKENNSTSNSIDNEVKNDEPLAVDVNSSNFEWTIKELDNHYAGINNSMAIDSTNNIHISYYDEDTGELRYATNGSGEWKFYKIDKNESGQYNSIAVDSKNRVHISYFDNTKKSIKYCSIIENRKNIENIDNIKLTGTKIPIVLGKDKRINIIYIDDINEILKYATYSSVNWQTKIIDERFFSINDLSLIVDKKENMHIVYSVSDDIYYLNNKKTKWQKEVLSEEALDQEARGISLELKSDSKDNLYVVYSTSIHGLKYITNKNGKWEKFLIAKDDELDIVRRYDEVSFGIDNNNKLHIVCRVRTSVRVDNGIEFENYGEILYLTNKSEKWEMMQVEKIIEDRGDVSLVVDEEGYVHICYNGDGVFRYATNRPVNMAKIVDSTIVNDEVVLLSQN